MASRAASWRWHSAALWPFLRYAMRSICCWVDRTCSWRSPMRFLLTAVLMLALVGPAAAAEPMAPLSGPEEPRVEPKLGEDGLYHQDWFVQSFLDLREDHAEAKAAGKRFAIFFEQRGCIYCAKMHKDVLSLRYINDYVRENFHVVQLDLWGSREVTDFDGTVLPEKKLAERWGILFTPTVVFFKDELPPDATWG